MLPERSVHTHPLVHSGPQGESADERIQQRVVQQLPANERVLRALLPPVVLQRALPDEFGEPHLGARVASTRGRGREGLRRLQQQRREAPLSRVDDVGHVLVEQPRLVVRNRGTDEPAVVRDADHRGSEPAEREEREEIPPFSGIAQFAVRECVRGGCVMPRRRGVAADAEHPERQCVRVGGVSGRRVQGGCGDRAHDVQAEGEVPRDDPLPLQVGVARACEA